MTEDERRRYRMLRGAYAYMGSSPSGNKIGSASGEIATFDTDLAAPLISLFLNIEPHQEGSGDPSPSNVRAISGWTGANVVRSGKNLLPNFTPQTLKGVTYSIADDGSVIITGTPTVNDTGIYVDLTLPAGDYFITGGISNYVRLRVGKGENGVTLIGHAADSGLAMQLTETTRIRVAIRIQNYLNTPINFVMYPQIEVGSTATEYEPYTGQTYPISFGSAGTVYGGTLDVTNGVLTVTDGYIAEYAGETLPSTWISDRDIYASGTSPTIGAQVVYKLATPITYQLTPIEVRTLIGTNNIFMDSDGTVNVEYQYRS